MRSLVVTTPAADRTLLTIAEMRTAAGVTDGSRDTELRALEARVAAAIMSECNIAVGAGAEPTLRQETLTENIYAPSGMDLVLSRRHNVSITSVTLDGSAVDAGEYWLNSEAGILQRLTAGYPSLWWGNLAVIVYQAGFDTVPGDLKQAAMDCFRGMYFESSRDPFVKSISQDIPGVMSDRRDYWVGAIPGQVGEGPVPAVVAGQLKRFRNLVFA